MNIIQLKKEREYQKNNRKRIARHLQIWTNIKNLLKSCIGLCHCDDRLFNIDGSLIDQNSLEESILNENQSLKERQMTWPYLLNIYSPTMTKLDKQIFGNQSKIHYQKLKSVWEERLCRGDSFYVKLADKIFKDILRTDQHISVLKKNKKRLFSILMTYCVYYPIPGYSQGMSDMLTPLVYVLKDESLSYYSYCSLMRNYMISLFDSDQIEINRRLYFFDYYFDLIDQQLSEQIYSIEQNSLFVYRWLLLDCKREFHYFNDVLRLLEITWIYSFSQIPRRSSLFSIFVSISILKEDREKIFLCSNEEDLNKYFFSSSSSSRSHRSIKTILERAQSYYYSYSTDQFLFH